jgi:hypothetical protein
LIALARALREQVPGKAACRARRFSSETRLKKTTRQREKGLFSLGNALFLH